MKQPIAYRFTNTFFTSKTTGKFRFLPNVSSVWGQAEWNSGMTYSRMRLQTGDSIYLNVIQIKGQTNVKIKA